MNNRMKQNIIYIGGFTDYNLQKAKKIGIIGFTYNPHTDIPKHGDYTLIYNLNTKMIETNFRIISRNFSRDLIFEREISENKLAYPHRWNVELVSDNLNITKNEVEKLDGFDRKKRRFSLLIRNTIPFRISDRYPQLCNLIMTKSLINDYGGNNPLVELCRKYNTFDIEVAVEKILNELAEKDRVIDHHNLHKLFTDYRNTDRSEKEMVI